MKYSVAIKSNEKLIYNRYINKKSPSRNILMKKGKVQKGHVLC